METELNDFVNNTVCAAGSKIEKGLKIILEYRLCRLFYTFKKSKLRASQNSANSKKSPRNYKKYLKNFTK